MKRPGSEETGSIETRELTLVVVVVVVVVVRQPDQISITTFTGHKYICIYLLLVSVSCFRQIIFRNTTLVTSFKLDA